MARNLILAAVFSNFFGFYIVQYFSDVTGLNRPTVFFWNASSFESIVELSIVYLFLFFASAFFPGRPTVLRLHSGRHIKGYNFYISSAILIFISFERIIGTNFSFSVSFRGEGQFDRGLSEAISRIILLSLPLFVYYRSYFSRDLSARIISIITAAAFSINAMSYGDRRLLVYFLVSYVLIIARERGDRKALTSALRKYSFLLIIFALFVGSYGIRLIGSGDETISSFTFVILQGTVGALGIGAILSEVKEIIHSGGGYFFGESFIVYIVTLFIPSFVLYFLGFGEINSRSSLEFNSVFNDNPNMGYDFMMVADFYWNFGYLGYLLYIIFSVFVIRKAKVLLESNSDLSFTIGVLLVVFFIAGQRSDFGFFLKSFVYCSIFSYIISKYIFERSLIVRFEARKKAGN